MAKDVRCFWCGGGNGGQAFTRDHLIPMWACRAFRELRTEHDTIEGPNRVVKACGPCNFRKGGMPPERFYHLRRDQAARKKEAVHWHQIQRSVILNPNAVSAELKAAIIEAMLKPIPGYDPPPHTKNRPLKRLYYPTPNGIKTWEELNPEIRDDRPL